MRKRITEPFTIPVVEVSTNLDWDDLHKFNDDFVTRYSDILSTGVDMRNVFERELSCHETGIKFFEIGKEYIVSDRYKIKVVCQIEEYALGVIVNDDYDIELEIFHDDESEYLMLPIDRGQTIQVKPI